jgi:sugar phosphate permease
MKIAGIVLLCLQGAALLGGIVNGSLSTMFTSGTRGFGQLIGFFLPAIIGIILLMKAKKNSNYW